MTLEHMRDVVAKRYPSASWARRVMNMSEDQVLAIYYHFARSPESPRETEPETQLRLF